MCGIIGYTGITYDAKDVLLSGLKNLEYRGYDSSGIAVNKDSKLEIYKSIGKIVNLEQKISGLEFKSSSGIGHTRWATHGVPNETNAHPHKVGVVTLVHNGIIENYTKLKDFLISKGTQFKTQTDTEVACAYINYIYENEKDKLKCIIKACLEFKGSYAFSIIFDDEPNTIYATRKDSPLIVGVSDNNNFVSSDISAILNYTNKYILLEHLQFAKVSKENVEIYDENLNKLTNKINIANWAAAEYQKEGFDHFMLKEINEQPKVLNSIFKSFSNNKLDFLDEDFKKYTNIHIVACGSAMHAGLVGKYLLETYVNIPVSVEVGSEYRYKNQLITPSTLVIIISQSGETADTLAALRIAKQKGAYTLAIVNVIGSTIAREANKVIYTYAGPEISVATTKGYTSQIAILTLIALDFIKLKKLDTVDKDMYLKIANEFTLIKSTLADVISKYNSIYEKIAKSIYTNDSLFFIGRGIDNYLGLEGSLKLKEISYMGCSSYAAGELKHGTISLIEEGTPVIAIASDDYLFEKTISNVKETKARGAFVILITTTELYEEYIGHGTHANDFYDILLTLPSSSDFTKSFTFATALQLIAYQTAKLRGCDIDKPRNLAKSVTVE